ncbi:MAG: dihydropteroate synthase [Actinobacteria bacterium]|nr:dihydropteroate synthase [Actinomycetota bacterium]
MGIVNVTPDSFAESVQLVDADQIRVDAAVRRAHDLVASGADIIDVGGESTRPGAQRVEESEELRRVLPVVRALVTDGITVSVDTTRARVASAAIDAGARIINDVSGGLADPGMPSVIADSDVTYIVMHRRGDSADMYAHAEYDDVVGEVSAELAMRVNALTGVGVDPTRLVIDPGLGFAKLPDHNWALLAGLERLRSLGLPLLLGASRKRFLGELLAGSDGIARDVAERDHATAALSLHAAMYGAWAVRVHDAASSADAVRVATRLRQSQVSPVAGFEGRDTVRINGVSATGFHGVFDFEREQGQVFRVDCTLVRRPSPAGEDRIDQTVNYADVADLIVAHISGEPVNLIETLAERIAAAILERFEVDAVEVVVHKPQAPLTVPFDDVSVTVLRWRS